jgi:hypothetical protein
MSKTPENSFISVSLYFIVIDILKKILNFIIKERYSIYKMTIYMPNIPRRKIYETMLQYEDGMIEMNILIFNKDNFDKFISSFLDQGYPKIRISYREIKALLVMFLEHRKYSNEAEFKKDLTHLKNHDQEVRTQLRKNKNLSWKFKYLIFQIDRLLSKNHDIANLNLAKKMYSKFDRFNDEIPRILELRRDHMK